MDPRTTSARNPTRLYKIFLTTAILGYAHWFFGNLYETVVLSPNLIGLGVQGLELWHQFFRFTNPVYYFIPVSPISVIAAVGAMLTGWYRTMTERKWLVTAAIFGIAAALITAYLVVNVNLKVFFGPLPTDRNAIRNIQWLGTILSILRVFVEGNTLYSLLRAYFSGLKPDRLA